MVELGIKITLSYTGDGETGYYTLRPGNNVTLSLQLYNSGYGADFSLSIGQTTSGNNSLDVSAYLENGDIRVGQNSTEEFLVSIVASENATNGYTSTFTVVAESTLDESNDFAVFKVTVTTRPPPQFPDNVSKTHQL